MSVTLLFVHGWGFDASFWAPLQALLEGRAMLFSDRGYFGAPQEPVVEGPVVVVAHSQGAMQAVAKPPSRCRGLVAINGFDCFAARPGFPGVSPRVIDRMLMRLDSSPDSVVADFRARCGVDGEVPPPDTARLGHDLEQLRNGDVREAVAVWKAPILSLQGARDPIVPETMRAALFASARQVTVIEHPDGGHVLPLTHTVWCAARIAAFVDRLA